MKTEIPMLKFAIKKIHVLLCFCLAFFSINLSAEEKILTLGGKDGWPRFSKNDSISFGKGRFGYTSVELATNSRKASDTTDMLLNFEGSSFIDSTSNYTVVRNDLIRIENSVMGHYCGLSRGRGKGIVLKGNPGSIFGTEGNPGTFAIEFWIKPSIAENGEVIFSWNSSRTVNNYVLYQLITATFVNSHVEWSFRNIFDGYTKDSGEVVLTSYAAIVPDKWSHHVLIFNEETGLLEYRINGKAEDLKYLTSTGHELGTIYQPVLGIPENISICSSFTGSIDDFRILHSLPDEKKSATGYDVESIQSLSRVKYDSYKVTGGRFETMPTMTVPGAIIRRIETIQSVPLQTEIRYYIRTGDNFYEWNDSTPEWHEIIPGQEIENVTGRYFQLAAELYPDGDGQKSPSITEIKITYYEPPLPLAPSVVKAVAGDGYVDLSWNASLDDTTAGYYVYYGTRPGEYLGTECINGSSPIKVGNVNFVRLTGLKNGAIYYFTVAAYSKLDGRIIGNFSDEVFARPKKAK
ncbi:LamG-like jellyroll fold domain-containing protein [Treponema sp.]|uniref:LamG-like jellyroll fold domain-containing protein n=1 Tax=Treponema sp. TaxID=166 RepID=UPI00298E6BCB|nr:LamG-like jellyroll fold domain-containing protein [Treponema sp.]MCR5614025.1 hypothetical protein [Treponema sp.]